MNEMAQCLSSNKTQCVVIFITNYSDEDRGTSLSHQVHAPLWWRSVSSGHSEHLLDHTPTVHGCPLPNDFATFLHGKEVTVWMMSCGALISRAESYTQLAAEVQQQVTALVLTSEAESTYSFSDSRSQI